MCSDREQDETTETVAAPEPVNDLGVAIEME